MSDDEKSVIFIMFDISSVASKNNNDESSVSALKLFIITDIIKTLKSVRRYRYRSDSK